MSHAQVSSSSLDLIAGPLPAPRSQIVLQVGSSAQLNTGLRQRARDGRVKVFDRVFGLSMLLILLVIFYGLIRLVYLGM